MASLPPAERRKAMREFLEARMQRAERTREALRNAIKAIDDGLTMEQVSELIPPDVREGGRGGFGMRGEGSGNPAPGPGGERPDIDELGPVPVPGMSGPGEGPGSAGGSRERVARPVDGPLTDEDRAAVEEVLASAAPPLLGMLKQLREADPAKADEKVRESLPRMRWLLDLRNSDRPMYDLRLEDIRHGREAFDAARQLTRYDRANPGQETSEARAAIAARLRIALEEQYRVRGDILKMEIERAEGRINQQKSELSKREGGREATIMRMAERLRERAREWSEKRRGPSEGEPGGRSKGKKKPGEGGA